MRRAVVALIAAVPLTLGTAAAASAHGGPGWGFGGGGQPSHAAVAGTIVSVDPTTGTFVANAFVLTQPSFIGQPGRGFGHGFGRGFGVGGGRGYGGRRFTRDWLPPSSGTTTPTGPATPTTTKVTISTSSTTSIVVNGKASTIAGLAAGDKFVALFNGSPSDSIQTLTSAPALAVYAHTPPTPKQLYAFVGTVTAVTPSTTGGSLGTVTVKVADSYPSGFFTSPATFTIGPSTVILGGASTTGGLFGGSLSDIAVGDTVAGGLVGLAGETATEVEATPLALLLAFPASSSTTTTAAKRSALTSTMALFGVKAKSKAHKSHKSRKSHKSHSKHATKK